jgi:hypothetical protein
MRLKYYRNSVHMMCCSRAVAVLLCWCLAVCFQTARAGTNVCVFQTGEWEISMSIKADRILLREPVRLKIECRNITREAQMALPDIRVILVSREGWQQNYLLYYNELFDIKDREPEEAIWVEPGAKETREYWLLLGTPVERSEGYPKKLDFLFGTPGKYQIGLAQYQDQNARVDVEVIAPTSREDLAACNMVSVSAAKLFLHSADPQTFRSAFIDVVKEGSGAIQAICDNFSSSTYAPYAALAMADITRGTNNPPANNPPAQVKVVLSVIALVLMALAVYLMCVQSRKPKMTVTNAGQKSIHILVVTVCGEDYAFQDIPVGGQRHLEYEGKGDSGFEIQGQFADGHVIKGNVGYVTTRSFPPVEVVIQEDGSVIGKQ